MIPIWRALMALLLLIAPALAQGKDRLTVAIQLEPPTLDPTSGAAVAIDEVAYATIFEGLVRATADGRFAPLLATGWRTSGDARVYDFDLRPGVRFHNGSALTADDVVFTFRRATAPGSTNAQAEALRRIAKVERTGPLSVRFTLREPDSGFVQLLSLGDSVIVSQRTAGGLATAPVGTGPFRMGAWLRGDAVTLLRNADYWGRAPKLRAVTFRFIADPTAAYAAMRAHDIDLFPDFPAPETLAQLRADDGLKVVVGPTEGEVILAMNARAGPLSDVRVRRALSLAIDRRAIIDGAMYGHGVPIGSHFPPQSPDYVDLTGLSPHDPARARALLAEAGFPGGMTLTLKLPPPSYARRSGEIIAAQLRAVGVRVTMQSVEWAQWLDEVYTRHDFDLTIVNHAEPFDYDIYGRKDYYFGYDSAAFRALLAQLRAAGDPAARHARLVSIQRRIAMDAPNAFLFQFPRLGVQDASLRGVWANTPNQTLDLSAAYFDDGSASGDAPGGEKDGAGLGHWVVPIAAVALLLIGWRALGAVGIASRLAVTAATLAVATVLVFLLVQVAPGDPASYMLGLNATPQAVAALHAELGLDGSALDRYARWVGGLMQGDFGLSYTYRIPVGPLIAERLMLSVPLALLATLVSVAIGVPAGYFAARGARGRWDALLGWAARIGIAVPSFWLAILLVLFFSVSLRWTAAGGFPGWEAGLGPALAALALPIAALALPQAAILARVTREALIGQLGADYVRTARAKGLSRDGALARHAMPNALGPVLTVLGLQVPFLIAGSAIIENVFFLPGLGRLVLQAIAQRDLIVVQSVVVVLVALTVLASLLVDLAQAWVDPRVRR